MHKGADLFYKCHFQTAPAESLEDPLWTLVLQIREWMCRKYRSFTRNPHDWSRFKYGGELRNNSGTVRMSSQFYRSDEQEDLMWACRIEEFSDGGKDDATKTDTAGQIWMTEIGYRESADRSGDVSIMLSYFNEPYYIGRVQTPPRPNIPKIVRLITNQTELHCNMSGRPLEKVVLGVGGKQYDNSPMMFWSRVNDPEREYPMVYVGKNDRGQYAVDPEELNRIIFPNALVCSPMDETAARRIEETTPANTTLQQDGINVFFPPKKGQPRIRPHGFSSEQLDAIRRDEWENGVARKQWGNDAPDPVILMLRRALAEDVRFSESGELITIEDVFRAKERERLDNRAKDAQAKLVDALESAKEYESRLKKLRGERDARRRLISEAIARSHRIQEEQVARNNDVASLEKELQTATETVSQLRKNIAALEQENEEAYELAVDADNKRKAVLQDLEATKKDLFDAVQQLRAYQRGGFDMSANTDVVESLMRFNLPDMLSSNSKQTNNENDLRLTEIFSDVYSSRIHIMPDAAKDCITKPELVWQGLLCMCTSVYDIYSQGQGSGSPEVRLKQDSRVLACFTLALSEGSNTNQNSKLVKLRDIVYEGRTLNMTPHLKAGHGKDSEETLRIYYCWDSVTEKIVIGHIGTHLLNDTGMKNKF